MFIFSFAFFTDYVLFVLLPFYFVFVFTFFNTVYFACFCCCTICNKSFAVGEIEKFLKVKFCFRFGVPEESLVLLYIIHSFLQNKNLEVFGAKFARI